VIEAIMIPATMKNMRGLEKAGRFSGGGVGDSMVGWMQNLSSAAIYFVAKCRWVLQKSNATLRFLGGENVVRCVVNVVNKLHQNHTRTIRHAFQIYFAAIPLSGREERVDGASSLHGAEGTRFSNANTA
jgi:hypothetical protein